jgi:hypothetical protein
LLIGQLFAQKPVLVLNFLCEVGETLGHGPRISIAAIPQSSPDLCSDLLHAVCIFRCDKTPFLPMAWPKVYIIELVLLFNNEHRRSWIRSQGQHGTCGPPQD